MAVIKKKKSYTKIKKKNSLVNTNTICLKLPENYVQITNLLVNNVKEFGKKQYKIKK